MACYYCKRCSNKIYLDKMIFGDYKDDVIEKFQFFKFTSLIKKVMDMSETQELEENNHNLEIDYDR